MAGIQVVVGLPAGGGVVVLRLVGSVSGDGGDGGGGGVGEEGFEGELVDRFVLAGLGAGFSDGSLAQDRAAVAGLRSFTGCRLWAVQAADVDGWLVYLRRERGLARSTVFDQVCRVARFYDFLLGRYQRAVYERTGYVLVQPVDEFNRPGRPAGGVVRVPPLAREVAALFGGWRRELPGARKYLPAVRSYVVASLWWRVGLRIGESVMLEVGDWYPDLGARGRLHVRYGKGSGGRGPRQRLVPAIDGVDVLLGWWLAEVRPYFGDDCDDPRAPMFPSERRGRDGRRARAGAQTGRAALADAVQRHLPAWSGRLTPHVLRHACASALYERGVDLKAIQDLLGHAWLSTTTGYIHVPSGHIERAWDRANARVAGRLGGGEVR
ncbi:tyrosine-type recombinase/integrase [Streptomyces rishiriensis]|uniref:Site-specific recombinase XerD n=1 Tax=Streptomyces rishiriensis TaxID=68264 RepID=A0ABU0NGR5_STRRH|nr:tyrosine-type recombinase/integrase [Streptomyces rishiriensis]MDQ0578309.1 site-specific recombinase XerD [Streptomyces rishiriensis]